MSPYSKSPLQYGSINSQSSSGAANTVNSNSGEVQSGPTEDSDSDDDEFGVSLSQQDCIDILVSNETSRLDKLGIIDQILSFQDVSDLNQIFREIELSGDRADLTGLDFSEHNIRNVDFCNSIMDSSCGVSASYREIVLEIQTGLDVSNKISRTIADYLVQSEIIKNSITN